MKAYADFARAHAELLAADLPGGPPQPHPFPPPAPGAPVALLFSPHPDDETITGALPLRLRRQNLARVVNFAVTLGGDPARRTARATELAGACATLGFDSTEVGWTNIRPEVRRADPERWGELRAAVARTILMHDPHWIFCPHPLDQHPAHAAVSDLVADALEREAGSWQGAWIHTEFWAPMRDPNLLVECPTDDLARLVAALCQHRGEVARNPYHLRLPGWMSDNVRRGAELLGCPGCAAPTFPFGTLYRTTVRTGSCWTPAPPLTLHADALLAGRTRAA